MKYLSAYLLLALAGKESPSAADVSELLTKLSVEVDAEKVELLVKALEGKNIDEVLEAGQKTLLTVGGGGAAPAAGGAAAPAAAAKEEAPAAKEEAAEIDMGGSGGLFGGDKKGGY